MNLRKDLETLEMIRRYRVRRNRKALAVLQGGMSRISQDLNDYQQHVEETTEQQTQEHRELLQGMKGRRISVDSLFLLKKKELTRTRFLKESEVQISKKEDELASKKLECTRQARELWALEKELIKIEEYIKSDVS